MSSTPRKWTLGTIRPEGHGDMFGVTDGSIATFREMLDGIEVVEAKAFTQLEVDFKELKIYYDDLYMQTKADEYFKWQQEQEYYKELETRYNQLLEETSSEAWLNMQNRIVELTAALNKIGMLGASEHAYTSEFTTTVVGIVREVLK